jgi:Na+-translocating ferredoxin:NAD+ oxidoreductase subunit G
VSRFLLPLFAFSFLLLLGVVTWSAQGLIETKHKQLDQAALNQVLDPSDYDNNLLDDVVLMSVKSGNSDFVKLDLLGLTRERLAFIAKQNGEVAYVIVPATASDGFNGYVDLLVALDMFGRIKSVRVVRTVRSDSLYGTLSIIPSSWLTLFEDKTFRDILRLSWSKIPADNEYDLFVGASVTPKTVSAKVYDALIFFQSNRVAFIQLASSNDV